MVKRCPLTSANSGTPVRLPISRGDLSVVFESFQSNYSFSRFLTLSGLIQMDTANTQAASANIHLRWNYRPDSDLFIVYTAGQRFASLARTLHNSTRIISPSSTRTHGDDEVKIGKPSHQLY
jgi:hypothetical protein